MMNFKKEFLFGFISIVIVSALIVFHTLEYKRRIANASSPSTIISVVPNTILSSAEILKHSSLNNCWIIIENKVYDVTDFLSRHPGGGGLITPYCGTDATQAFLTKDGRGSHSAEAFRLLGLILLGDLNGKVINQFDKNAIKSIPIKGDNENDD